MNITTAKQQVKDTVEAYLRKDDAGLHIISSVHQRPLFLVGAPGIGKTAIMEQVARELEIGLVSYSMTHHTRQSALGLPRIEQRSFDELDFEATEYTMSEIIASVYDYMEKTGLRRGILFLDEINCVSETLYPSMLQFLQFKTFGKHKVPEDWVVVCAGNPVEYNRSVHEFDVVTLDRLREIEVEPDYGAWRGYAVERGLHPAVTTFLETKKDCFYKVESKPGGGKAFVTARGWEDLAQIIALYEDMGKPVNRELFVQFLRDDDIADQFSVYYALFEKYRSDYQVNAILEGEVAPSIARRAKEAPFDERVALIGLLLDALAGRCSVALDQEGVVLELREVLREVRGDLQAGASVESTLGAYVAKREQALARKLASGTAAKAVVRRERKVLGLLRSFMGRCTLEGTERGDVAFHTLERAYKEEAGRVKPAAEAAGANMDAAFDFVDECLGTREMLVFMAELATRKVTTQFVARYGNDRYYEHNAILQADSARMGLADRASKLDELSANIEGAKLSDMLSPDMGGAAGLSLGGGVDAGAGSGSGSGARGGEEPAAPSAAALRAYYGGKQFEYGFASICKMVLPAEELRGKAILDVCCRRGMGVYKLSATAGERGRVVGVDWSEAYIAEARGGMDHAWRKSGLSRNNMEFKVAFPEDLIAAGIGSQTMDAVYVNNVVTLFCDQAAALREFGRVLRPGGLLVLETVFADRERDEAVVSAARELGNSIQAARTEAENRAMLAAAGFGEFEVQEEYEVRADRGNVADQRVSVAPGDEDVRYKAVALYVRKR